MIEFGVSDILQPLSRTGKMPVKRRVNFLVGRCFEQRPIAQSRE